MIQEYGFYIEGEGYIEIQFDDALSVQELIQHVFNEIDCYEPLGMEIVKLFECHSSKGNCGWFIDDTSKSCAETIDNRKELCIAYHLPNAFYYAEGGWGHHMKELGNHPILENPISLNLRFEGFNNTVVIAGKYTFWDIIGLLKKHEYIPENASHLLIHQINPYKPPYIINFKDKIIKLKLSDFITTLPAKCVTIIEIK